MQLLRKADDVVEASWWCRSGGGECERHPFRCRALSSLTVHRSFGSQEFGRRDDGVLTPGCLERVICCHLATISDARAEQDAVGHAFQALEIKDGFCFLPQHMVNMASCRARTKTRNRLRDKRADVVA